MYGYFTQLCNIYAVSRKVPTNVPKLGLSWMTMLVHLDNIGPGKYKKMTHDVIKPVFKKIYCVIKPVDVK